MKKEAKLILGGGAAYGLAHIGAIAALREHFEITGIVGTSMGAIIGGLIAMGKEPAEILRAAQDNKTALIFNPLIVSAIPESIHLSLFRGLHDRLKVINIFRNWTDNALIEDLPIPFVAVTYDLHKRTTVLFDRGCLAEAMRASSSLPLLFAPLSLGAYKFVDGGVEHPLPLAFGNSVPGNFTIAINVLPEVSTKAERIHVENAGKQKRMWAHQVFIQTLLQNQGFVALQAMLNNPPDLYIDAHDSSKGLFDLMDAQEFYDYGYQAAMDSLANLGKPKFREQMLEKYQALIARFFKR